MRASRVEAYEVVHSLLPSQQVTMRNHPKQLTTGKEEEAGLQLQYSSTT